MTSEITVAGVTCGPRSVVPGERAQVIYDLNGHALVIHRTTGTEWISREDFNATCAAGLWTPLNTPTRGSVRMCAYMLRDHYPGRDKFLDALLADPTFFVRESGSGYILVLMKHAFDGDVPVRDAEYQRLLAMNTLPAAITALFMSNIENEARRAGALQVIAMGLEHTAQSPGLAKHFLQAASRILERT